LKNPHHDEEYPVCTSSLAGPIHYQMPLLSSGKHIYSWDFRETINPVFIEEEHVYRQFGPEAPAVLDRCFYLAGLPDQILE
jgi:O-phosphoseryl-tRNA synthetase